MLFREKVSIKIEIVKSIRVWWWKGNYLYMCHDWNYRFLHRQVHSCLMEGRKLLVYVPRLELQVSPYKKKRKPQEINGQWSSPFVFEGGKETTCICATIGITGFSIQKKRKPQEINGNVKYLRQPNFNKHLMNFFFHRLKRTNTISKHNVGYKIAVLFDTALRLLH